MQIIDLIRPVLFGYLDSIGDAELAVSQFKDTIGDSLILAAGPLVKQPGTLPYRTILRAIRKEDGMEFAIHNQIWQIDKMPEGIYFGEPNDVCSYDRGDYFPMHCFVEAVMKFASRLSQDAELHFSSIYRNLP